MILAFRLGKFCFCFNLGLVLSTRVKRTWVAADVDLNQKNGHMALINWLAKEGGPHQWSSRWNQKFLVRDTKKSKIITQNLKLIVLLLLKKK